MMSPEKMPHIPEIKTTPERVLEEMGGEENVSGKEIKVEAPYPEDFMRAIQSLE